MADEKLTLEHIRLAREKLQGQNADDRVAVLPMVLVEQLLVDNERAHAEIGRLEKELSEIKAAADKPILYECPRCGCSVTTHTPWGLCYQCKVETGEASAEEKKEREVKVRFMQSGVKWWLPDEPDKALLWGQGVMVTGISDTHVHLGTLTEPLQPQPRDTIVNDWLDEHVEWVGA